MDAVGRLVRTLAVTAEDGRPTAHWDCTSVSGRRVAAGVYFYELRSGSALLRAPVVVLGN